jgi:hypothetical protein
MSRVTNKFIEEHPDYIYIFGDNEQRRGLGGQAKVMRPAPLSIGIRTKRAPSRGDNAYWTDDTFEDNKRMIDEDIGALFELWEERGRPAVVLPYGIGEGMSELPTRAPRTHMYLTNTINSLILSKLYETITNHGV